MVDPRLYRAGLALVALAVIVFGFSFENQPGPVGTSLAPTAFSGSVATSTMQRLASEYPTAARAPGSVGDDRLAATIAADLRSTTGHGSGFSVVTRTETVATAAGSRPVQTVIATRPGLTSGAIVVTSDRDGPGSAGLSGSADLLELAHVLAGETTGRSIVLVSTSGSEGAAGAAAVAAALAGQPVDAVIALGDLAGSRVTQPTVVPFSDGSDVAPPVLRQTVGHFLSDTAGLAVGGSGLGGQLAHLAFPLTLTAQGPFGAAGIPAVLISTAGDRLPSSAASTSATRLDAVGSSILQSVDALDAAPTIARAGSYLLIGGKLVPPWAVRLLVLALILPVLVAALDAGARARRRGHSLVRWVAWVLAGAVPFILCGLVAVLAGDTGILSAPPEAVGGRFPVGAAGIGVLVVAALVLVGSFALLRPLLVRMAREVPSARRRIPDGQPAEAAALAILLVVCLLALALWVRNPLAALLLVPALHLWLWLCEPAVRARRVTAVALVVGGLVAPVLVAIYYLHAFGWSPPQAVWSGVLLLAGGGISLGAVLGWGIALGAVASAAVLTVRTSTASARTREVKVTVRGPAGYAGPGSLGGTESALRR